MDNTSSSSGGIGICGATFIVFLVLKLLGKIDWSVVVGYIAAVDAAFYCFGYSGYYRNYHLGE